jgi:23S rRNA pseudouridine955/2504/2580 synthase
MHKNIIIDYNNEGIRFDRYIKNNFPQIPMGIREKLFRKKLIGIFRENKRLKLEKSIILKENDEIKIFLDLNTFDSKKEIIKADNSFILKSSKFTKMQILYEDDYLYIVDKPANMAVHSGSGIKEGNSLIDYFAEFQKEKDPLLPNPKLIHRLDKDTSGLIMISKTDNFLRKIIKLLQNNEITKQYIAFVKGKLKTKKGSITEKISRNRADKYNKITIDSTNGKESVTHYEVLEYNQKNNISKLKIILETGRMHQIRIHFSSNNHPLAGDNIYGDFTWNKLLKKELNLKRQALHAYKLMFTHPETNLPIKIESKLPKELEIII